MNRNCDCARREIEFMAIIARLDARVALLETKLAATEAKLVATEAKLAATEAKLAATQSELAKAKKNSSNSSKPPSSDIVKPPKPPAAHGGKRKIGGQHGHAKHEREPFPAERIDRTIDYELKTPGKLIPLERLPQAPPK